MVREKSGKSQGILLQTMGGHPELESKSRSPTTRKEKSTDLQFFNVLSVNFCSVEGARQHICQKQLIFSTDKVQSYFQVLKTQWLCQLLIHVLIKRMVKHRSSKYGWHIYNRCFHDECRKQGKFKKLDVVCFDHKSCVLANKNLKVNYM